jgi:hypothetical protein
MVVWDEAPPGWARFMHLDMPDHINVTVRIARTSDGLAPEAVLVERNDGRAVTARDLRSVKLPQPWMLARGRELMRPDDDSAAIAAASPGRRRKDDAHWRTVYNLWVQAHRNAPHAPVRWMREEWPDEVSDATMRRWIKRAQERADINQWKR